MRIERLEIEGFGPFAETQTIDFEPLDEAGVFLITGRTGSGKSSILDAICFALYGTAPRYDSAQARLRSDHAAPETATRVVLQFSVAGQRWRVTRSPEYERPKQRGTGTTRQPQSAALERWDGGGWQGVAARAVDVGEHLAPVLQLTREQFLQVILLAQGRFQEFLRARSEDRLGLLRALFGTERFQRFEAEVGDRARALEQSVGARAAAVDAELARLARLADDASGPGEDPGRTRDLAWAQRTEADLAASAVRAEHALAAADAGFAAADRAAARAASEADLQRRRDLARAALDRAEGERPAIEDDRRRVADAVRALPVMPALAAAERALHRLRAAEAAASSAAAALGAPVEDPAAGAADLDALLGGLAGALRDEAALPASARGVAAARERADAAVRRAGGIEREAAGLPAERDALQQRHAVAAVAAARSDDAGAALTRAGGIAAAAARAGSLADAARRAEAAWEVALDAEQVALGRTRTLLRARLAGAAGLLAAQLVDGEPCAVCGSAQHPTPAVAEAALPDDAAVAAAEAAQQAASARSAAARSAAIDARTSAGAAATAAGGATVDTAAEAVEAARQAVDEAQAATAARLRIEAEIDRLGRRTAELDAAADTARTAVLESARTAAGAAAELGSAQARVAEARGDAASVAGRVAAITARRALLRAAAEASAGLAGARTEQQAADERLVAALADAGLPDATAARAAATSTADRQLREGRVRAWDDARASAAAALADPDVAGAPHRPADVEGTRAAKQSALAARDAAADDQARARSTAAAAAEVVTAVRRADAAIGRDRADLAVLLPLADAVRGAGANERRMRLESYVLAARLEQIVDAANARLVTMTDGRFTLRHDDSVAYRNARSGLGLEVLDEHTGRPRPIASLSGGETFLASLALALGLAEVVSAEAGGVRLDTLFVDEGFGSLDRQTLDTAMETLDSLRAGGRVVGLISHVEAMQEDIPAGLHVERSAGGASTVRLRTPAPLG